MKSEEPTDTRKLRGSYEEVTRKLRGSYEEVTRELPGSYQEVTRTLSWKSQLMRKSQPEARSDAETGSNGAERLGLRGWG